MQMSCIAAGVVRPFDSQKREMIAMRSFRRRSASMVLTAAVTMMLASGANLGFAQHFDVFVTSNGPGTQLVIGGYDDGLGTAIVPVDQMRVFEGEVVGTGAAPYESGAPGEPGFRAGNQTFLNSGSMTPANVYTALAASTNLTFNFQPITIGVDSRNLFFWDGVGAVDFAPIASSYGLDLTRPGGGGWTVGIDGSTNSVVAGNTIQTTSSVGVVHNHLYTSIDNLGGAPDQGFYLYSLQFEMAGYSASDSIYFVYGALDPSLLTPAQLADFEIAHAGAATWVQDNLVPVPEPSTYALLALGAAAIPLVRLRRRMR